MEMEREVSGKRRQQEEHRRKSEQAANEAGAATRGLSSCCSMEMSEGTDSGRGVVPSKSGSAAEQGSVLCRDRQHRDSGESVRLEQQLAGEEMKESPGSHSPERGTGDPAMAMPLWGDQRAKLQNLHLRAFQTCLSSPGWSHSGSLFQKEI